MSIARSSLTGGPAYVSWGSTPVVWHMLDDSKVEIAKVTDVVKSALFGEFDEVYKDLIIKASGTPLFYDATVTTATMFPYISQAAGPILGASIFGSTDIAVKWASNNGDVITISAAAIGKMPDIYLGVDKPVLGPMEIWGLVASGEDPDHAASYYTMATAQSFAAPAVPGTSSLQRQKYTAAWGTDTGFTSFQAQEGWTITHELKLEPIIVQGRTVDFHLAGYRAMAKCKPVGPTLANIDAALRVQGAGGYAKHGQLLSTQGPSGAAPDLVISGQTSGTFTIKNAGLKTSGYVFGAVPLRNDEIGFVGTLAISSGTPSAALVLA